MNGMTIGRQGRGRLSKGLDAFGWVLFFVWIGAVLVLPQIPRGVGALGVGIISLFGTLVRLLLRQTISWYWVIIGVLFLAAGGSEMMGLDLPLLPIALIVTGVLLLQHRRSGRSR